MLTRLSLVAVLIALVGPTAGASPITYAFTGSFDAPFNGSKQLSGSFTINGDPTLTGYPPSVSENGNDVSLTVRMGGQTFHFDNQSGPRTDAGFTAGLSPTWLLMPQGPQQDEILIRGASQSPSPNVSFFMSFFNPSSIDELSNLRTLGFNLGAGGFYTDFNLGLAGSFAGGGSITSIGLVPTQAPEPSTMAIFATIGAVALARHVRSMRTLNGRLTKVHRSNFVPFQVREPKD